MPEDRQSFWTTLPGILTGLAALITALVGLAALFLGRGEDAPPSPARTVATGQGGTTTAAGPGAGRPTGGQGAVTSSVLLQSGDGVDVDTGMYGSNVVGDLYWGSNQLDLYGRRNAVVTTETDEAGCRAALEHRSDGYVTADGLAGGVVVCLSTDQGAVAQARVSAPDVTARLAIDLTVWPG